MTEDYKTCIDLVLTKWPVKKCEFLDALMQDYVIYPCLFTGEKQKSSMTKLNPECLKNSQSVGNRLSQINLYIVVIQPGGVFIVNQKVNH